MTSEEIAKYLERSLSIDCPHMKLRKEADPNSRVYEGPGSIYQTTEGDLIFKLYARGAPDYSTFARSLGPNSIKPGEMIPRDEYFALEATSLHGAIFRGEFILPEVNQGVEHGPAVRCTS
jgi:hypothetical protein